MGNIAEPVVTDATPERAETCNGEKAMQNPRTASFQFNKVAATPSEKLITKRTFWGRIVLDRKFEDATGAMVFMYVVWVGYSTEIGLKGQE